MKIISLYILFLFFPVLCIQAQTSLPDSPRKSAEASIYTINRDNLREIYLKDTDVSEDMLETQIATYKKGEEFPALERGNYIIVEAIENQLSFTDYIVDDLYFKIVPAEEMMLCLYDSSGNIIPDAIVKCGSKKLKFNETTRTYNIKSIKSKEIVEIDNKGVYHYIEIENRNSYYYAYKSNIFKTIWRKTKNSWHSIKNIFNPEDRERKEKYMGFVVFNKPKYKPGETVKLKAYLAELNGKPYNKPVDLRLYDTHYYSKVDTILVKDFLPYRPGMYEYQFKLTDSLDLKLDTHYMIVLDTKDKRSNQISSYFKYEDYELKSIRFSMTTDKREYVKGDSMEIKLKVSDENEMAVYGGRAEIYIIPQRMDAQKKNEMVFIPDTLWRHDVDMNEVSEKTISILDSVFPQNASFYYEVKSIYLSADNEKRTERKQLYWNANDYLIDFSLSKGMLTVKQLYKGESQKVKAKISMEGENGETIFFDSVTLPHTLPIPWCASDIIVKTDNTKSDYSLDENKNKDGHPFSYTFYRQNDSIFLKIDNPANIPFWYTIRKGKQDIASGYNITHLNYSIPDKNREGYYLQLSYLFAGSSKSIEQSLPFAEKNITLDVSTPTSVYPGQKTNVLISVADKKGQPVKDVDVTAYSFTSKFNDYYNSYSLPSIPIKGKTRYAKNLTNTRYISDESAIFNKKAGMTWDAWKTTMALDTIEYYKFLYPETFYKYTEPTPDGSTLLLPYVVVDGTLQGIYMLWIDDKLYYANPAQQMEIYAFQVSSGKHDLKIRTYDREILVRNLMVDKGTKNIFSFDAGKAYTKIESGNDARPFVLTSNLLDKKRQGILSEKEINYLSSQLITIDNNFGKLELPGINATLDLPAYIFSGNTYYYLNQAKRTDYNRTLRTSVNMPILAGPFPTRSKMNGIPNIASVYADDKLITNIEIEGGNNYTVYENYQKIKNWKNLPFSKELTKYTPVADFKQEALTPEKINRYFDKMLKDNLTTLAGSAVITYRADEPNSNSQLILSLGKSKEGMDIKPELIFIFPEKEEEIANYRLYYGGSRSFRNLPQGNVKINLVFNDSTSFTKNATLHPNGKNYLNMDSIEYENNNEVAGYAFRILNRNIKKIYAKNPYTQYYSEKDDIVYINEDYSTYNADNAQKGIITGIVLDLTGEPLIGVSVSIEGTTEGTVTDFDGQFRLLAGTGNKIRFSYIGYLPKSVEYSEGADFTIVLREDIETLEEVVVVGYGVEKKQALTGSVSTVTSPLDNQVLQGRVAGISIRGTGSIEDSGPPLIIVNGLPFDGSLEDIDAADIVNMTVLKDENATAIYGARAANGVIMIQTNALSKSSDSENNDAAMEAGNSMRRNFHDDAFWQPRLRTDEKGEASFEVTYPDDITAWNAYFIAIGNKNQTDKKQLTINSFKALTARLSLPGFTIRGDSLNAVGRIANHLGDSIQIERRIEIDNYMESSNLKLASSYVDHIPVKAEKGDSLTIAYSLQMQNGYFDGEEHSIPIFEQGILQTHGDFKIINDSETHQLKVEPSSGTTTIYAEASSLELFLREIEKVDKYPYMCNEQMASKIKVLLSKKRIAEIFGREFKDDKKINELISRLNKNKNQEGLWGWWNQDKTEFWISKQIVSAMLDAENAGYKTNLDKQKLARVWGEEFDDALSDLRLTDKKELRFAKQELLDRLIYLKQLNAPYDYQAYFEIIDSQLKSRTITDKLKTMYAMSVIGLHEKINIDSLMRYADETILGSIYWSDDTETNHFFRISVLPHKSNIENTLIAYSILKNIGGHKETLEKIRNYFFECRSGGSWQNTYESSRIIETIMPDMLNANESYSEVSMYINGKQITDFPYKNEIETTEAIEIRKEGTLPLFITVYQQEWNKQAEAEDKKGFSVKSYFVSGKDSVSFLTAGKSVQLEVIVNMSAEAHYVQIEVPIPAGCSYESKGRGRFWNEAHREHFKEKVLIFSNKLTEGEHKFSIDLIPRYTGEYHLNPAKAELMYYPTFYGNEELKIVTIQ